MSAAIVVVIVIVFVVLVVLLGVYNRAVRLRNMVRESWHDIDTELQRRYDLIPNLVETVKGYAAHEQALFEKVAALRADAMTDHRRPDEQASREQALGEGVGRVLAVAEGYPDLKASENFLALQGSLVDTEDRIQVARRIYNANVRSYNSLIQAFPGSLVAGMFHFAPESFFQLDPVVRQAGPPPVDLSGGK